MGAEGEGEEVEMTYGQRLFKACILLGLGTIVCTLVSDPMVDVISNVGKKVGISGLYFASRKTKTSISLTLATLHGAAIMNNTLALSIFMGLVYFRKLSWQFGAEVIALLIVVLVVGVNALRPKIFMWQAGIVIMMYPLSLVIVFLLKSVAGLE